MRSFVTNTLFPKDNDGSKKSITSSNVQITRKTFPVSPFFFSWIINTNHVQNWSLVKQTVKRPLFYFRKTYGCPNYNASFTYRQMTTYSATIFLWMCKWKKSCLKPHVSYWVPNILFPNGVWQLQVSYTRLT